MKKIVFSTGAGISAESGFKTFRDADGLWENYPVMQVASHSGYLRNPGLIHEFYNMLRKGLLEKQPNAAHIAIKDLEKDFDVHVITQNVDDFHERAGSRNVLHLHGELMKVRSTRHEERVYTLTPNNIETSLDTRDEYGDPVRPHIVFFEEAVPNIGPAIELASEAEIFVVIGTSLVVYPAASLINYVPRNVPIYYIDPKPAAVSLPNLTIIRKTATEGMKELTQILKEKYL